MDLIYNDDSIEVKAPKGCSDEFSNRIDSVKQTIQKYLKSYDPILTLLRDTMTQFCNFMLDDTFPITSKQMLHDLFFTAYDFLINFVKDNTENQVFMHKYIEIFLQHIRFDVG